MTGSATATRAVTITDARHVGAKIGTDLRLLRNLYGRPSLADIDKFAEEAALLLRDGYLGTVDYGFKDTATNTWKLRLRYTATTGGQLRDDRPGHLGIDARIADYSWSSYLTYSTKFGLLTPADQQDVKSRLPVTRVSGAEPTAGAGNVQSGHGYSRNGLGVSRNLYTAW